MLKWIQKIQNSLVDFHDPSGSHFHLAWKACLAGLLAAVILYFAPQVGQPIMVVAAMIFAHKTTGSTPRQQQLPMLRAALIVVLGIGLLACLGNYLLLQAILLVILSFLAQYAVQFGSQYNSTLTWILILVAIADTPPIPEIPKILLNVVISFFLAFICFFGIFPYNPQKALEAIAKRTQSHLAELLDLTLQTLPNQPSRKATLYLTDLKYRIVSLIDAQQSSLKQLQANAKLGTVTTADRQLIASQQEIFEAIAVLEQALLPLKYSHLVSVSLQPSLQQFSAKVSAFLNQSPLLRASEGSLSIQPDIGEILQKTLADQALAPVDRVYLSNLKLATQNLLQRLNALLVPEVQIFEPETSGKPATVNSPGSWLLDFNDPVTRLSTRTAIAVLIAMILERSLNLPHGDWVTVSALIVSRDSVGNTFWKAKGRFLGTALGVAAALIFYALIFRYHTLIFVTAFITIFPYLYLRPSLSNYGYAKFFQQFAFICFLGSLGQAPSVGLLE